MRDSPFFSFVCEIINAQHVDHPHPQWPRSASIMEEYNANTIRTSLLS